MGKRKQRLWLIVFVLALSSCASSGTVHPVACPTIELPPLDPTLTTPPNFEQQIRGVLFESDRTPTQPLPGSRPN